MTDQDRFDAHLRLTILRLLSGAPAYRSNSSILHGAVQDFGFVATRDQIKSQLAWLEEQRLVSNENMAGLIVATLTDRGLDTAAGAAIVPGVQRPAPK